MVISKGVTMVQMIARYQGEKHCEIDHSPSGAKVQTDAPKDNHGKGEQFSPTDLVGAATASCMLTVMAICAESDGYSLEASYAEVTKEMKANPRRISRLTIQVHLPKNLPDTYRPKLENIALNCPVKLSLNSEIDMPVVFSYDI
jgi:uncharacterized OsmC-like protein